MKKILLLLVLVFWIQTVSALSSVACTEEAKLCSDWKTWVSRWWNNCEFQECPNIHPENPTICTSDYTPVCWKKYPDWDEMWGITYKTFSNKCELSNYKKGYIFGYKGKCKEDLDTWVSKTCQIWYDWCNTCKKAWSAYVCTKRMCIQHWTPKCLDKIIKKPPVSCPVFKLMKPPYLCKYHYSLNENWCKIPKLVCEDWISYTMRIKLDKLANKFLNKIERKFWPETFKRVTYLKNINKKLIILWNKKPKYKNVINYLIRKFENEIKKLDNDGLGEIINILN